MKYFTRTIAALLLVLTLATLPARAQSMLRDAETEAFLREISDPIFVAAGLTPQSVQMYLIGDPSINAFVAGGQNIFIFTGLWDEADDVNQLLGVIAHETGHITGGHLARIGDAYAKAGSYSILSMVLGAAAMIAGSPDAGMGILMAGQNAAQRSVLAYSRVQESSADQAGASFLEGIEVSGNGLIEFFEKLRQQEILSQINQDPYIRTHPLTSQRILRLQGRVETSPYKDTPIRADWQDKFERLKAKMKGYLDPPVRTLRTYPLSDTSITARYARVYAYHKQVNFDLAFAEAEHLIAAEPNNPYFYEIYGQILFENGRVVEALVPFEKAASLAPNQPLILTAYGQALIARDDPDNMTIALPILERATRLDPSNTFAWFNLARIYAWKEMPAMADLATAERFFAAGVGGQAMIHARRALGGLKVGTPQWLRAQDILAVTEPIFEKQQRKQRRKRRFSFTTGTNIQ